MISSRPINVLFHVGLALLSMNTISTRASLIPGATNGAFRGRRLQVDNIPNRNSPSIDDQMDNIPSIDEPSSTNHETQPSTGQVHNSPSADDGGLPTSSKPTVIAPKARRCNTSTYCQD